MRKLTFTLFAAFLVSGVAFTDRSEGNSKIEKPGKFQYIDKTSVDTPELKSSPDSLVIKSKEITKYLDEINSKL